MDRNGFSGEPGPEPDTSDAAVPDDTDSRIEAEDAPKIVEEHGESVDDLDL